MPDQHETPQTEFLELEPIYFPLAKKFYKEHSQSTRLNRLEQVFIARRAGSVVACLRLTPYDVHTLLRSLFVSPEARGQNCAKELISVALKNSNNPQVWTFPYTHLKPLYAKLGFMDKMPNEAPAAIREALQNYQKQGRVIDVMAWSRP